MTVALAIFFTVSQSDFATWQNLMNIFEASSPLLLVSIGLTVVLLVAEFDISISGVLALSGLVLAKLVTGGMPPVLAIIVCTLLGALIGTVWLGIPVAFFGMSSFILSIALLAAGTGLALLISNGEEISMYQYKVITALGNGHVLGIPAPVVISVVVLIVTFVVLRYTGYGRRIYAVGGNLEMSRLAGVNVVAVKISAFALAGAMSALAGIVEVGRLTSASPLTDANLGLTAAAAVLLGGTSFRGGKGSVIGTLFGVLFLGVLANGLIIASISIYWQGIITGLVLAASISIDRYRNRTDSVGMPG